MSMGRIVGGNTHVYEAQRTGGGQLNGNYTCRTIDPVDTKIVTDFIGIPNTFIHSIRNDEGRNGLVWSVGEVTQQGTIREIRLNNQRGEVLLDRARTVATPLNNLQKRVAAQPVVTAVAGKTVVVPNAPTLSRSNLPTDPFAELEAKILKVADIRLEKTLKKSLPTTLKDFLVKFFKVYNDEKNTIYVSNKTTQTTAGRRRSLGDIYKLCKYYFPDCTLREVVVLLYTTLPATIRDGFRTSYCTTIKKRVWYYEEGDANGVFDRDVVDEYGNKLAWYTSKI